MSSISAPEAPHGYIVQVAIKGGDLAIGSLNRFQGRHQPHIAEATYCLFRVEVAGCNVNEDLGQANIGQLLIEAVQFRDPIKRLAVLEHSIELENQCGNGLTIHAGYGGNCTQGSQLNR